MSIPVICLSVWMIVNFIAISYCSYDNFSKPKEQQMSMNDTMNVSVIIILWPLALFLGIITLPITIPIYSGKLVNKLTNYYKK